MAALAQALRRLLCLPVTARLAILAFFTAMIVLGVSPRSTIVVLTVSVLIGISVMIARDLPASRWMPMAPSLAALLALASWGMLSAHWSQVTLVSLSSSLLLGAIAAGTAVAVHAARYGPPRLLRAALLGATTGYAIAVAAITFEVISDQWLARTILQLFPALQEGVDKHVFLDNGRIVKLSEAELNRRICVATLLLLPMLVALREVLSERWHKRGTVALLACFAIVLPFGTHQSSLFAMLAGALFAAALTWQRMAMVRILSIGWILVAMFVVPATAGLPGRALQCWLAVQVGAGTDRDLGRHGRSGR